MKYEELVTKLGTRYDIVNGILTESPAGELVVTDDFSESNAIYLNRITKTVSLIIPKKNYIGRTYILRRSDCISLVAEWLSNNTSTDFNKVYSKITNKAFMKYYKEGISYWFEENNFTKVTSPEVGDCLIYAYKPEVISHAGVFLENNKILHHLPYLLSSIDNVDMAKVIGVYRYAN